jgi:outer membrane biosynthesis protein TonB
MIKMSLAARMMLVGLAAFALLFAACSGEGSSISLPEGAALPEISAPEAPATEAPTTEAPTTEAPTTEAPAADAEASDGDGVPVWVWVLLGLVLVGLVAWFAARAGSGSGSDAQQAQQPPPQQPPPPPPTTDQEPPSGV